MKLVLFAVLFVPALGHTSTVPARTLLDALYVPAPPKASLVYEDKLENAGVPMMGAYADTNEMVVHALKGKPMDKVSFAHELGHLFDAQILTPGDRRYFSRLLGTDPNRWDNLEGATSDPVGSEAFGDYYAAAGAGVDLKKGGYTGYVSVDPKIARKFNAAIGRLGRRHDLKPLNLLQLLASGR